MLVCERCYSVNSICISKLLNLNFDKSPPLTDFNEFTLIKITNNFDGVYFSVEAEILKHAFCKVGERKYLCNTKHSISKKF